MVDLLFCPIRPGEGILGVCSSSLMWLVDKKKAYERVSWGENGRLRGNMGLFLLPQTTDIELLGSGSLSGGKVA